MLNSDPFAEFDQAGQDFDDQEPQAPPPPSPQGPAPAPAQVGTPPPAAAGDPDLEALYRLLDADSDPRAQQPAAPAQAAPQVPQAVPYDRFQQVTEENRYLRSVVERALGGAQVGPQGQPAQPRDDDPPPDGYDPDVWAYLKPIRDEVKAMRAQIQPQVEQAQRQAAIENLSRSVPGFSADMVEEMEREFASMSPEQQERYRNEAGIEAIAHRVVARRGMAPPTATSPRTISPLASRAHSISRSGGVLPPVQPRLNINDLTDEQFERYKAEVARRRYGGSLNENEPDPILDGRF